MSKAEFLVSGATGRTGRAAIDELLRMGKRVRAYVRSDGEKAAALRARGVDIAQCMGPGGFTPWERLRALRAGMPGLIHSMGIKPWTKEPQPPALEANASSLRRYYEYLHMELTPYVAEARKYTSALGEDYQWTELRSPAAKIMAAVMFSSAILQEFPLSLLDTAARSWRRWLKIARYPLHEEFCLRQSPLR